MMQRGSIVCCYYYTEDSIKLCVPFNHSQRSSLWLNKTIIIVIVVTSSAAREAAAIHPDQVRTEKARIDTQVPAITHNRSQFTTNNNVSVMNMQIRFLEFK